MMGLPEGTPSHWVAYFAVADADAAVAAVEQAGGPVLMPRFDTPYGRMAPSLIRSARRSWSCSGLMHATSGVQREGDECHPLRTPEEAPMTIRETSWPTGTPCWVDLAVPDVPAATMFYRVVLGWSFVDTGPELRHYTVCRTFRRAAAAIGPGAQSDQPAAWTVYLASDDADKHRQADRRARRVAAGRADRHRRQRPDVRRGRHLAAVCSGSGRPSRRSASRSPMSPGHWSGPTPGSPIRWPASGSTPRCSATSTSRYPGHPTTTPRSWSTAGWPAAWAGCSAPTGGPRTGWPTSRWTTWTRPSADALAAGGTVVGDPQDTPFGRTALLADPFGATFGLHGPLLPG